MHGLILKASPLYLERRICCFVFCCLLCLCVFVCARVCVRVCVYVRFSRSRGKACHLLAADRDAAWLFIPGIWPEAGDESEDSLSVCHNQVDGDQ